VTGGFEACRDAKKERLRRGRVGEGGGEARVRECRRDISESSGAFGAIVGSPPSGFDAVRKRKRNRSRPRRSRVLRCDLTLTSSPLHREST